MNDDVPEGTPTETDDDRQYLQTMLRMQPTVEADAMLVRRRQYLASRALADDEVLAVQLDDQSLRPQMLQALAEIRHHFWTLPAYQMHQDLKQLATARHPEVAAGAGRLIAVSEQREAFARLAQDEAVHPAFAESLQKIVVATPAQANRLRERQFGFIRPSRNPQYLQAQQAIQASIRRLMQAYPGIYALEQTWLNELVNYDPQWDIVRDGENNGFDTIAGLIVLAVLPVCAFVVWAILF
ncbi:hypothetical protein [Roseimaritima sediminicola]|uniref:hypothetical protein n=1 Tax=Roseimaritima sediminicola TaxID=2662066 RepID=UPI0012983465|nr:hypothetical protein [Roseimaritima sediminicola]